MKRTLSLLLLLSTLTCFGSTAAIAAGISITALKNGTYHGVGDSRRPVRLHRGHSQIAEGRAHATVELADDFAAYGDLDGDGVAEAVVLLNYSAGGSGIFSYLAVVSLRNGQLQNTATQFIGDRVQVRDITIRDGRVIVDMVAAAATDPFCCPSRKEQMRIKLSGRSLIQTATIVFPGKLGVADIGAEEWRLARGPGNEPTPGITLAYRDGRFVGFGGCNQFFMGVSDGPIPGQLAVSSLAGVTRKACEEPVMTVENRFLAALGKATRFSFLPGGLAIAYEEGAGKFGMLLFER